MKENYYVAKVSQWSEEYQSEFGDNHFQDFWLLMESLIKDIKTGRITSGKITINYCEEKNGELEFIITLHVLDINEINFYQQGITKKHLETSRR